MIIDIPKQNKFYQGNDGDLQGSLSRTFNVDLEQDRGKITLSRRCNINTTTSDEAGLTTPTSFSFFGDKYYTISGGAIYKSDSATKGDPSVEMSADADTGVPTGLSDDDDLILFNSKLYCISDTIDSKTGSTWSNVGSISGGFHSTTTFANRLYISQNSDNVISVSEADSIATSGSYTLDLNNSKLDISSIRASSDGIWIATINTEGGRARVYKWDGVTENTVDATYEIPDVGVKALIIYEDTPHIITSRGLVMRFNGSFFQEIARFPFYYEIKHTPTRIDRDTWLYDNCVAVVDNKIHINIGNRPLDDISINDSDKSYAGIWVLDEDFGLYHKYSFSNVSPTSNNPSAQVDIKIPGAIYPAALDVNTFDFEKVGKFITGAAFYSDATTVDYGIFSVMSKYEEGNASSYSTYENHGWFVTSQIQAQRLIEDWDKVQLAFKQMNNSTDKIVLKYRTREVDYAESTITWTSTTTFTSTGSEWATIKTNFEAGKDHEVTILRGKGGGMCSHITDISETGGTYTVTVDETHTGATSGTAKARIQQWTKIKDITDANSLIQYETASVKSSGTWIQLKVFLFGKGKSPLLERIILSSEPKQ